MLLAAAACAPAGSSVFRATATAPAFRVAVMGDMPYTSLDAPDRERVLAAYRAVLDTIASEDVAFVVHVGDITRVPCTDSLYAERVREFAAMPHPLVYTFGDNEWTDCGRDGRDPLERLATLRRLFTAGSSSLGARPMALERQSDDRRFADYRENARWRRGGVTFATLHVVGSNDNRGSGETPSAEHAARRAANLAWMREAFAVAERNGDAGVALFMQANPFVGPAGDRNAFPELLAELRVLAAGFGRPVALVHGDTHHFRVDQPLEDPETGRAILNVTRAETWGNPESHALLMTVDAASPNVFRFEPLLVRR